MNKKIDIVAIIGLLLTLFTLFFGDDIYRQINGHSIFEEPTVMATTVVTIVVMETHTVMPIITLIPTATFTLVPTLTPKSQFIPTVYPTSNVPNSYTLQVGEFPYCIARRFNVDPDMLLSVSGLSSGLIEYPMTLKMPQNSVFPGDRMLARHPAIYTVSSSDETIYGIACKYGDVFPEDIASLNGLSVNSQLSIKQVLHIP